LTIEHLSNLVVTCPIFTPHCDAVLTSKFAELWGIPVALFGVLYYLSVFLLLMIVNWQARNLFFVILFIATFFGFIFSIILVYIQIWVLSAVCAYCMLSAGISILLFSSDLVYMLKEKIKCGQIEQTNDSTHDL
ncbi:vitamin K epoxide reductase family protein, partial [Patescibacteria group bacterium]|nr:vitamin K epoxide reductase family protein [Patescibacteria group bacterium]